jgi:hypothetical protein
MKIPKDRLVEKKRPEFEALRAWGRTKIERAVKEKKNVRFSA